MRSMCHRRLGREELVLRELHDSDELTRLKHNTPTIDFNCPKCKALFQLKGRKNPIGGTLADAAYGKMREAVLSGAFPNHIARTSI